MIPPGCGPDTGPSSHYKFLINEYFIFAISDKIESKLLRPQTCRARNAAKSLDIAGLLHGIGKDGPETPLRLCREAGERWQDQDLIFCTRNGKPLAARNVRRAFRSIAKAAGIGENCGTPSSRS
jgi:hypothetical protein